MIDTVDEIGERIVVVTFFGYQAVSYPNRILPSMPRKMRIYYLEYLSEWQLYGAAALMIIVRGESVINY